MPRRPSPSLLPSALAAILAATSACAGPAPGDGIRTDVVLLAGGFVRFDGARMPVEQFVVEIRKRVRSAAHDASRCPEVHIRIEDDQPPGRLDALLHELQTAGVRRVVLG
jgi:hypothetical protein